jgi:ribose 5-phosphate isomerase B
MTFRILGRTARIRSTTHSSSDLPRSHAADRGIVLGGSGNGEAIVANKVRGIRCALCWNVESARLSRQHNDANMCSLGQRLISLETALEIVRVWLDTPFEGGRHARRIALIESPLQS